MVEGRYDIQFDIASHDFFFWLIQAKARGAQRIVFGGLDAPKGTKYSPVVARRRFRSIIEPGPALLDLPHRVGDGGSATAFFGEPNMGIFIRFLRTQGSWEFPKLKSVLPPRDARFTVTLRRTPRIQQRNSNEAAWRRFAEEIGAVVIEDYDVEPMHLHDKMALYAGAQMNFGVHNGPVFLCMLAGYPVTLFGSNKDPGALQKCGVELGGQLPWARPDQSLVWQDDDYDTIRQWFDRWQRSP